MAEQIRGVRLTGTSTVSAMIAQNDSFRVYTRADQLNANGYGVRHGVGVSFRIQEDTGNLNGNIALIL